MLQDHPASTQVFMSSDLILDICADLEAVRCIKLEAVPTPPKIAALRAAWAERPPASVGGCTILTGLGALYAGFDRGWNRRSRCLQDASVPEHAVVSADYPRGGRGRAAARLRGISTWQPRRRRDSSPRNIHVEKLANVGAGPTQRLVPAQASTSSRARRAS